MGKAEIIADLGAGHYTIKRVWAGREAAQDKIVLINTNIANLQSGYSLMPESTEDELFAKHIVKLQMASLQKQVEYIENNFPDDIEVDAYCADYTEDLSGEVGTIDIPGEVTELVNIRPGHGETAAFDAERDGEFWPSIAVGPWTSFLNKCILPGWQKWYPKYRYGWIAEGTLKYDDNTCDVLLWPAGSSQQGLDVNQGDGFGTEIIDEKREVDYFYQPTVPGSAAFQDFCDRNPDNPICSNTEIGEPVQLTDEQYEQIRSLNYRVNSEFRYESDASGHDIGEYFDIMYDPETDAGDCEDYALTKMHQIIEAGILPAKNIQLIFCSVSDFGGFVGHAVAGIQTINRGFLILDNLHPNIMQKSHLTNYRFDAFQLAGTAVVVVQRLKGIVPIDYMGCNSEAFNENDEVIVEFTGMDWEQPKVIGFVNNPGPCSMAYIFPSGTIGDNHSSMENTMSYAHNMDVWSILGSVFSSYQTKYGATGESGIGFAVCGQSDDTGWRIEHLDRYPIDILQVFDSVGASWSSGQRHPKAKMNLGFRSLKNGRCITTSGQYTLVVPGTPPSYLDFCWWFAKEIYSDTHEYIITTNSWANRMAGIPIYYHADFVIKGKLYVTGGSNAGWIGCSLSSYENNHEAVNQITSEFDNDLDVWSLKQALPYKLGQVKGWNLNGKGFIGGGSISAEYITQKDSGVFYMSPVGFFPNYRSAVNLEYENVFDTWTEKKWDIYTNAGMGVFAAVSLNGERKCLKAGELYRGGGYEYSVYDSDTDMWARPVNIPDLINWVGYNGGAEL